jgi:hypothetical protein
VFPIHARGSHVLGNKGITHSPSPSHPISPRCLFFDFLPQHLLPGPFPCLLLSLFPHIRASDRARLRASLSPARPITAPTLAPFAAGMPHRKPLATLDPQSAHSRLTEDMSNSQSSSRLPVDPKDAAANRFGRQIVSRGSIYDEGILVQSASSSRKNSLAQ